MLTMSSSCLVPVSGDRAFQIGITLIQSQREAPYMSYSLDPLFPCLHPYPMPSRTTARLCQTLLSSVIHVSLSSVIIFYLLCKLMYVIVIHLATFITFP